MQWLHSIFIYYLFFFFLQISRLESVSSAEELSDVYAHFTLYYGKDLVAMRNRQAGKAALDLDVDTSLDGSQVKYKCHTCISMMSFPGLIVMV